MSQLKVGTYKDYTTETLPMVLGRKVDYIFISVVTVYVIALCVAFYNLIQ